METMKSLLFVTGALMGGSDAFVPTSLTNSVHHQQTKSKIRPRSQRQNGGLALKDQIVVDPKDPAENDAVRFEPFEDSILSSSAATSPLTPVVGSSGVAVDEGAEIFLNSILQTNPDDILAEADAALDSMFADTTSNDNDNNIGTESPPFVDNFEHLEISEAPYDSFVDPVMNDDLKVVLEASGAAAAAAEATMSEDLLQQLDAVPITNGNATDGVVGGLLSTPPTEQVSEILPASAVVGESATAIEKIQAPSVGKILKFAIPAIGVWLCGPLLSLIDTSAVGILSGTTQQAALNPAVAVTDYAALLIVSESLAYALFLCFVIHTHTFMETHTSNLFILLRYRHSCIPVQQILLQRHENLIVVQPTNQLPQRL